MKQRSISAIGVVIVGLLPAILGGWTFAIVFTLICLVACHEALAITSETASPFRYIGLGIVMATGLLAALDAGSHALSTVIALAVGLPLAAAVFLSHTNGIEHWTATAATSLYLALPTWAAITLRGTESYPAREWLGDLAGVMPDVSNATGGGLAWFLLALLVTWLSDTFAYLVGKSVGRTRLIPRVSPNKTVEGAIGGLVAAGAIAVICDALFGMELGFPLALLIGIGLGIVGQIGDLSESMLKRARGVKDSGNLIPGHGGVLDRIDALVFILVAAWLIAPVVS